MNTNPPTAARRAPASVAPTLLERHKAALRSYVQTLAKGDATQTESIVESVWRDAQAADNAEFQEDPTVWLFANARRRVVGAGRRDDPLAETGASGEDDAGAEGEDPRVVVHRSIGGLTPKQQETLRLKFQFNLNLDEIAAVTGQPKSGTGWLLHHAIAHIGQALGAREDDSSPLADDPRVTLYALDEMEPNERSFFEKGVANGQALLDREKAIREWAGHVSGVLSSGAPMPKRRKKGGATWWKNKAWWIGLVLVAVGGALVANREKFLKQPDHAMAKPSGAPPESAAASRSGDGRKDPLAAAVRLAPARDRLAGQGLPAAGAAAARTATTDPRGPAREPEVKSLAPTKPADGRIGPDATLVGPDGRSVEGLPAQPDQAKPESELGEVGSGNRPPSPASGKGKGGAGAAAENAAPLPAGPGDSEVVAEIEIAKDQPGKGKPPEEVDVISAMGGMKKQLASKQWPRRERVRFKEMLKNVPESRRPPEGEPLEVQQELAPSPWDSRKQIVRVSLRAKDSPAPARGAAHLVFAIDVSKSMKGPNRLPLVREGVRRLVDRLRSEDRISVVTYAEKADVLFEAQPATRSGALRAGLGALEAKGLTNGAAGLRLAYATARNHWIEGGHNIVVLCTDGNFNLGDIDEAALAGLAASGADSGIQLSVFGFGRTDRNDLRLEVLATHGGGRSCYVNTEEEAERQLVEQIQGLFAPAVRDVRLQVEFNPAQVEDFRRIGDEPDQDTTGAVPALLPGRSLSALFEIMPASPAGGAGELGRVQVDYALPGNGERRQPVALAPTEHEWARTSGEFRFAVAMTEFGRILRGGQPVGTRELDRLEKWVRENLPDDAGGYRTELLQNLEMARELVLEQPANRVEAGVGK